MTTTAAVIAHTEKWIMEVVIGLNFCPFAAQVVKQKAVHYTVLTGATPETTIDAFAAEAERLNAEENIETSFLILPEAFDVFTDYLDIVWMAERWLVRNGYEGVYQVASFHPQYQFAGSQPDDAANYTNRSPYPMLHLLREAGIERVLENYKNPDAIPQRNIRVAEEKGLAFMQALWEQCFRL